MEKNINDLSSLKKGQLVAFSHPETDRLLFSGIVKKTTLNNKNNRLKVPGHEANAADAAQYYIELSILKFSFPIEEVRILTRIEPNAGGSLYYVDTFDTELVFNVRETSINEIQKQLGNDRVIAMNRRYLKYEEEKVEIEKGYTTLIEDAIKKLNE